MAANVVLNSYFQRLWDVPFLCVLLILPVIQKYFRFKRARQISARYDEDKGDGSMAKMTNDEAWSIIMSIAELEFPFFYRKALQFALFRTYGITSISTLLVKTAQLSTVEHAGKRYADTGALITEFYANPPSHHRTLESFARLNYIHGFYRKSGQISDEGMLYTLALFAQEPLKWINRYEWRELSPTERCAIGTFHKAMGDAMEISFTPLKSSATGWTSGVHFLSELMDWAESYETEHMKPSEANHQTAEETVAILLFTIPSFLKSFVREAVYSLMDSRLRTAMLYPAPSARIESLLNCVLTFRKCLLRYAFFPRPHFLRYTNITPQPDANGRYAMYYYDAYPFYVRPTLWNRWGPEAWARWCMSIPLPGDDPSRYESNGFFVPDVGPTNFRGKGAKEAKRTAEKLRKDGTRSGCPFI